MNSWYSFQRFRAQAKRVGEVGSMRRFSSGSRSEIAASICAINVKVKKGAPAGAVDSPEMGPVLVRPV